MKCHRWRQRVKAGAFIDNTDQEHAPFVFLHPRELISIFLGEGGGREAGEESKNDRQIKISHWVGALGVSLSR